MRRHAKIKLPAPPEHKVGEFCIYYQPNTEVCFPVRMHNNCFCNEYISLRNRVLMEVPRCTKTNYNQCMRIAKAIADWIPETTVMDGEWTEVYTGRKRNNYLRARDSFAWKPLCRQDGNLKSFVKAEKIQYDWKDPRMIQARSTRYNYALGNYLKPIEHALYNIKGSRGLQRWLPSGRLIAKGLCQRRRAYLIRDKMKLFHNTTVYSLDASRFDAHVTDMLNVEHTIYKRYWRSPELQRLLDWQYHNKGYTAHGIKYKMRGGRCSGDMNTALGNCLIAIIVLASVMKNMKIKKWNCLCDGDDVLLFVPGDTSLDGISEQYLAHGFELKLENKAVELTQVRFCQSYPIHTADGLKMVQSTDRVLSRALVGSKHWSCPKFVPKYLSLIGDCELALAMGVPVHQAFALMVRSWGHGRPKHEISSGRAMKAMREIKSHGGWIHPFRITPQARADFEDAMGISVYEQIALERAFEAMTVAKPHGA
nr:hypothetical protein 2 [Mute swan feces associated tombus-like virus 4]